MQGKPTAEAVADLQRGFVDAVFLTGSFPIPAVHELAARQPVRLLSLPADLVGQLRSRHPFLIPLRLPERTYPGLRSVCTTVGVTAMLVARQDTPDSQVEQLLGALFSHVDELSRGSLQAYFISPKTALSGISIPLHPAAERYFRKSGS